MEITNLVTSPFGIGTRLIFELLKRGESVYTVFASPKDVPMSFLGRANLKYGFTKLDQELNIEKGLPHRAVHLFHIYEFYNAPSLKLFHANTMSTLLLLEWAKKVKVSKFIYLSSGEVYGQGRNLTESAPFNPKSFYATTKLQAEMLIRYYSKNFELKIVRLFFPFGKGLNYGYLHHLFENIKSGQGIETDYCTISPTYIDDIIEPLLNLRDRPGYIVSNFCGTPVDIKELVEKIEKILGNKAKITGIGKTELSGSGSNARETLNYKETPLDLALKNALAQ
uniref:NAD(P)-dependent oxidoreductase n=1 Tax=candidate division WOR-3 bacterium TaxID=2052148 RepID=A0A7C4TIK2_UNCW3